MLKYVPGFALILAISFPARFVQSQITVNGKEVVSAVGCPVLSNLQYGHIAKKLTIPFGVRATLDTRTSSLRVSEGAVR